VVRFLPDARLPRVPLDADQLRQVVLNLLINAKQALAHGGEIIVETKSLPRGVQITVTDTGPGMTAEVLERCFLPYFSTKRGGSGLGLPTSRRIVEDHGGSIQVQSERDHGTRFTIRLPLDRNADLPLNEST
jgi:signal transduction histidine kinase